MKRRLPALMVLALAVLATVLPATAHAQARYGPRYQQPQWFTFRLSELSAGAYAEGTYQTSDFRESGGSVTYTRTFAGPALGLVGSGSIYHPNLLQYNINADGAFGYSQDRTSGSGGTSETTQLEWLGRVAANAELLSTKPYKGGAFLSYDNNYRDTDFFTRVLVETLRYGGRVSWDTGPVTFYGDYVHRDENSTMPYVTTSAVLVTNVVNGTNVVTVRTVRTSTDQEMISHEDNVTAGLRNERARGGTTLNYNYNRYTRQDGDQLGEGTDQSVSLADSERFGAREQYRLNTSASFSRRDTTAEQSDEIVANAYLNAEHTDTLSSFYDFNFDDFKLDTYSSQSYSGSASLQHQLYDSLLSTLTLRASDNEFGDNINEGFYRRYGAGITLGYTKRLTDVSRLRINTSTFLDHVDQMNQGTVVNERHALLPDGEEGAPYPYSFFLNLPGVMLVTIVITDQQRVQVFQPGSDYEIIPDGSRVLIRWITVPGRPIPPAVLASYQSEPTPPGNYEIFSEYFQARLEFWKNLWGVYGRVNLTRNNAEEILRVHELTSYVAGSDVNWRWLNAGAEYEIYDSTESDYRAARLFQSLRFRLDDVSTLNFDFLQTFIQYQNPDRQEQNYRFIARYRRALSRRLAFDVDAGVLLRRGEGVDELNATLRPHLKYVVGKTTIDTGYDYEYLDFLDNERRQKHMLYVRLKRMF
jgi:hypothetical protein